MAIVLCMGLHSVLTQTRKLILERESHTVVTAHNEREILAACREFRFDVAVIGQSVTPTLKHKWSTLVREHCPAVKILELYVPSASTELKDADDWLESPAVPAELAQRVALLASKSAAAD